MRLPRAEDVRRAAQLIRAPAVDVALILDTPAPDRRFDAAIGRAAITFEGSCAPRVVASGLHLMGVATVVVAVPAERGDELSAVVEQHAALVAAASQELGRAVQICGASVDHVGRPVDVRQGAPEQHTLMRRLFEEIIG